MKSKVIAFLFVLSYCFCLKSKDLCFKKLKTNCSDIFPYECDEQHCSMNKLTCTNFGSLNFVIRRMQASPNYEAQLKKFKLFKSQIEECTAKAYKWNSNDVCMTPNRCFEKRRLPIRTGDTYIMKQVQCTCIKKHSFKCLGISVCAQHKTACDILTAKVNSNNTAKIKIKYCPSK
jgi:hypothetical protein